MRPHAPLAEPFRTTLLGPQDPPPFTVHPGRADSPFVLVCDHAGQRVPQALGDLGVAAAEWQRHIAWDIGAEGLAIALARQLQGWLICQTYSRLVIDCNRPFGVPGSITTVSERTPIPGNQQLSAAEVAARQTEIFTPYHQCIGDELDRRQAAAQPSVLVSVHSFTPVYLEQSRPWQLGLLYHRDARLAKALLPLMRADGWCVGDNQPYAVSDASDYAVPVHGERRGLPHIALEVRQDLISESVGQQLWAVRLAGWLRQALTQL